MIYLVIALTLYFAGKVFFKALPKDQPNSDEELWQQLVKAGTKAGIIIVVAFILGYAGDLVWDDLTTTEKKVTVAVLERNDPDESHYYLRLSDGATLHFYYGSLSNKYNEWLTVKKGDKIQKVIYNNKQPTYSPVFDE